MRNATRYSDDDIASAVAAAVSVAGVLRTLGIKPAGGSPFHISKRIKRLGLDTCHFTGQGHNKGKRQPRKPAEDILVVRSPELPRAKARMLRRALLEIGVPAECLECGTTDE